MAPLSKAGTSYHDRKRRRGRHRSAKPIPAHLLQLPANYSYAFKYERWSIVKRPGNKYTTREQNEDNFTLIKSDRVLSDAES